MVYTIINIGQLSGHLAQNTIDFVININNNWFSILPWAYGHMECMFPNLLAAWEDHITRHGQCNVKRRDMCHFLVEAPLDFAVSSLAIANANANVQMAEPKTETMKIAENAILEQFSDLQQTEQEIQF